MSSPSQKRALPDYRQRLRQRGMARFEVLGLNADRDMIRSLAKRLAQNDQQAARIRATLSRTISGQPPRKGGILKALRRSPLVGAESRPAALPPIPPQGIAGSWYRLPSRDAVPTLLLTRDQRCASPALRPAANSPSAMMTEQIDVRISASAAAAGKSEPVSATRL
jgi:hypothetical protein